MKSNIFLFTMFVIIGFVNLNAQTITDTVHVVAAGVQEGKLISKTGVVTYNYSSYAVGKIFPTYPDSSSLISRTYLQFSLTSIPTNATITSVKVNYITGSASYTFKITKVTSITPGDDQANWSAIGNGTTMDAGITYGSNSFLSSNIKTQVQNLLSTRLIILGTLSENETANNSYSSMNLSLDIIYTRPAAQLNLYAQNDLDGAGGGNIGVGVNTSAASHSSPYNFSAYEQQQINLQAYDNQYVNSSTWVFNDTEAPLTKSKWDQNVGGNVTFLSDNSSKDITAGTSINNATFIAYLQKYVRPTFQNYFVGLGNGGVIKINNVQYNSPATQDSVVKGNAITANVTSQSFNNITYYFSNWSTSSTSSNETFYPSSNVTITANYVGIAAQSVGLYFTENAGQPIILHWSEYPNSNVTQYQIWRRVRYNQGTTSDPELIATVNRGTTSYTDYDYSGTSSGHTNWQLWYDVRSYYSTEGTYPDPNWAPVFSDGPLAKSLGELAVTENKIENYPNPFNPSTVIRYQLVNSGPVSIKVYDIVGREIMTLVNEEKQQGRYQVKFDASNLSSGIYFYRIVATGFTESKKMILTK